MKDLIGAALIAVSMYSKIPVPGIKWTPARLKYVMMFFPVVGVICGLAFWGWYKLAAWLSLSPAAAGLIGAAIPVVLTGGIHLDGFMDTLDARSSYREKEKKLEILKDPHLGAFSVIGCLLYYLFYTGFLIELFARAGQGAAGRPVFLLFGLQFVVERGFSGLSVLLFPQARTQGLAHSFAAKGEHKLPAGMLLVWIGSALLAGLWIQPFLACLFLAVQGIVFVVYRNMAVREFGGVTGDLAGWFLQVSELAVLAAAWLWLV